MITLIIGGSGSGKSAYAEDYVLAAAADLPKYYIATMQVYDAEGERKVERHRRLRAGKGFVTIEQPTDIGKAGIKIAGNAWNEQEKGDIHEVDGMDAPNEEKQGGVALLECMSNLVANEMFSGEQMPETDAVVRRVTEEIEALAKQLTHLVIVSNNVFEDGIAYDASTLRYIEALGRINTRLADLADHVLEVVVGIPVTVK
ncbi:MAG: bifunctional adenosylcobinamide kinase/adenosylcobinamide-phosphate guanylyltransferase [Lachnobacterium sp.]|nr:bifunctional adenosylcobinamide kinase/adenosylcobinamide-phosphate guanylyltransferase [Lachnobacterium sp.]